MPWSSRFALCRNNSTPSSANRQYHKDHPPTPKLYNLIFQLLLLKKNSIHIKHEINIRKQCYKYPNDVKWVDPDTGQTPLCLALTLLSGTCTQIKRYYTKTGAVNIIAMMLELYPAALYIQDEHGRTPLHYAIREVAPYTILELICNRLCFFSATDDININRLSHMLRLPNDVTQHVLSFIPNPGLMKDNVNGSTPLLLASSSSDNLLQSSLLEKLLCIAPSACSIPDLCGYIPLHYICRVNCYLSTDVIEPLICAAPNTVMVSDKNGNTPLHHICKAPFQHDDSYFLEAVRMLIDSYPDAASMMNKDGKTPLHNACHTSLSAGVVWEIWCANPNSLFNEDGRGMTPLQYARSPHQFANPMMNRRILQMLFRIRGEVSVQ